jgi:hypothetical protein
MKTCLRFLFLLTMLFSPFLAQAQQASSDAEFMKATEEARTILQTERKLIVTRNLDLTVEEASAFWPIYDRYAADMKAAGDLRLKLIVDFADNYTGMTDDKANQLLTEAQKYEQKVLDVRKQYVKKMRAALPPIKLARFFQIESKLNAIGNLVLASQIPLVQ